MNSSISGSDSDKKSVADYRVYLRLFGGIAGCLLIFLVAVSIYIQPLTGELTRLGFYAERDFGWNMPQKRVNGDANLIALPKGSHDVLIVGDSFSTNGVWQPFFSYETGLSYATMDLRKTDLSALIGSQSFVMHQPKILIVQAVEREFLLFFKDLGFSCRKRPSAGNPRQFTVRRVPSEPEYIEEVRPQFDITNINLRYTVSVLAHGLLRRMWGGDSGSTRRFDLTTGDLFSNQMSREILIYEGDMDKLSWKKEEVDKAVCSLRGLQDLVQSNGRTLFIFMLAPDKSSAYAGYISQPLFEKKINLQQALLDYGINSPRIDVPLVASIDSGEKDIYSPNGTHWSAGGYKIAADVLVEYIKGQQN